MSFHRQWVDHEINDSQLLKQILFKATHLTIAVTDGVEPCAVPINHLYDAEENVVCFHCAKIGKKMEILRKNPHVWCLAVIDKGLVAGICQNLYASVMFSSEVTFLDDNDEKLSILRKQIQMIGGDIDGSLKRLNVIAEKGETLKKTAVGHISMGVMTGKRSTSLSEEKLLDILD